MAETLGDFAGICSTCDGDLAGHRPGFPEDATPRPQAPTEQRERSAQSTAAVGGWDWAGLGEGKPDVR